VKYTLSDGVAMCKKINEIVSSMGYFAGLTGSTILGDGSDDDIDIIIYPGKSLKEGLIITEIGIDIFLLQ
jgi:predicted nucleotidyltransferase